MMRDGRRHFPRAFKWWVSATRSKTTKWCKSVGLQLITLADSSNNVFHVINPIFYPIKLGYPFSLQHFRLYLPPDILPRREIECSINFKNPHSVCMICLVNPFLSQPKARKTEIKQEARAYNKCFVIFPVPTAVFTAGWPQSLWDLLNLVQS